MLEIMRKENIYAHKKRWKWIYSRILEEKSVSEVLDIGCGTGIYVTVPLNITLNNRGIKVFGTDIGEKSIIYAKKIAKKYSVDENLFDRRDIFDINKEYDVVICSEVLEHIEKPYLYKFVEQICRITKENGLIIITVPNGKGSFEWGQKNSKLFWIFYNSWIIKNFRSKFRKSESEKLTITDNPHVNFFAKSEIVDLFKQNGAFLEKFDGSCRFCNIYLECLPKIQFLLKINDYLGSTFPSRASGYYFAFRKK